MVQFHPDPPFDSANRSSLMVQLRRQVFAVARASRSCERARCPFYPLPRWPCYLFFIARIEGGIFMPMQHVCVRRKASHIFLAAAQYIESIGWQEKGMGVHGGPRCSMGALASAHLDAIWDPQLSAIMYAALVRELQGISLTEFNRRARNGTDVARLLRSAARSISCPLSKI